MDQILSKFKGGSRKGYRGLTGVPLVKRGSCENFWGAKFNANLHFNHHVKIMQSKACNKLRA